MFCWITMNEIKETGYMKTEKDYQEFANELKMLCEKHGIFIVGTCFCEGIFGEIALVDKDDPSQSGWINPLERVGFDVDMDTFPRLTNKK